VAVTALRYAREDGASMEQTARALALAYVGALGGGYVFEWLRVLPDALGEMSFAPFFRVGRAAYGGLIFGVVLPALYLRRVGASVGAFLDRVSVGTGLTFLLVRTGCFLEGCDYGTPTAAPWGVRFPPGSYAATAHAWQRWVAVGARSLPVHPTQLYEAAVGALGAAVAWAVLRRRRVRDGAAFLAFLGVYAAGRFGVELLRGDAERGRYGALSTGQVVSLALLVLVAHFGHRLRRTTATGLAA